MSDVWTSLRDMPGLDGIHNVRIRHRADWKGDAQVLWDLHYQQSESYLRTETKHAIVPGCILAAFLHKAASGAIEDLEVAIKTLQGLKVDPR